MTQAKYNNLGGQDQVAETKADGSIMPMVVPGGKSTNCAIAQVSVGASAVQLLAANEDRTHARVHNPHATVSVYLGPSGGTAINTGFRLAPGQSMDFPFYAGAIWGIGDAAGPAAVGVISW